jgi:hypothetical protein
MQREFHDRIARRSLAGHPSKSNHRKCLQPSAISKRTEQSDYDRTARVMARNRLQALVSANVR